MKNIWRIFTNDWKNIGTNWVAAILIGGLILLPSLYAWFNIAASWDPYGQTDQIPIGVVNEDEGATVRDEDIDVGGELVDSLKDDDSMDWQFVDRKKAMDKVEYGDYFAVIVIPKDFSEKLGTVISDNPEKANVEYYVNEKINAIAPKITQKGATVIVDEISSNFISTVNGVIFDMFNEIGVEIEAELPDIERFENYVFEMEKRLPEIHKTLETSLSDASSAQDIVKSAQGEIPKAEEIINNGLDTIDNTTGYLKEAEDQINEMGPKIKADLEKAQNTASEINDFLDDVNNVDIDFEKGKEIKEALGIKVDDSIERINAVEDALNGVLEQIKSADTPEPEPDENQENGDEEENKEESKENNNIVNKEEQIAKIEDAIEKLEQIKEGLQEGKDNTEELDSFIDNKKQEVDDILGNIKELSTNTSNRIDAFVKEYNENIEPTVLNEIGSAKKTLSDARGILTDVQSTIPEVEDILARTGGSLDKGKGTLEDILGEYPYVNDKVKELADKIRKIQGETDINEIIDLLQNDPDAERGFFAEPVELHENKLFPIENYGTGMTPFYTVLSLWVGGLLLISLLATDVVGEEKFTSKQVYFGRLLTFLTIGLLQTLVVTLGDMFLIHVDVAHPVWFVVFGLLISMVFMTIVYTVVSVFGDVGKAMAIVLLVLQLAGSGGTYPVVLLPKFFQIINPYLPFTYAIDLMRETVGGIVWERVFHDMIFLGAVGLAVVLFGAFFKKILNKQSNKLMKKSRESGLFH
ncbi:putative membrane protein [Virgibacillus halotolerans]|uniref:YhgE/Pip domain-containing protein n=1 Tax=Virgibacillus halotolerans TaxID=1071053 RepID=UPI0019605A6D|nr:YhgE/Pip domain-containing protein [Virgibacillus halotolerans]MBM7600256.1 putative membrane protein [Virgibacillus halotolerans]